MGLSMSIMYHVSHEYPMNIQHIRQVLQIHFIFAPGADDARSPWRKTRATCPEHCYALLQSVYNGLSIG